MVIAICDDWPIMCTQLRDMLLMHPQAEEFSISLYYTGEALCTALEQGSAFDLIILDIMLPGQSGVDLGKYLRERLENSLTQILYISAEETHAMDLFAVQPLNFLIKPIQQADLFECVNKALDKVKRDGAYIAFSVNKVVYRLLLRDIRYVSSNRKQVIVHTVQRDYQYYGKMSDLGSLDGFIVIHHSFWVNCSYIRKQSYESLQLDDGTELTISKPYRQAVRTRLAPTKQ